ncbi:DUF3110 domain-containing protein [Enterococcus raffinosus]|uniref:DUF3110 domain-containing protein n=1 Tax=Enterococcus raffinosus TaxID=71452 RepID=UPI001C9547E8|nr:DUF3110 domain-containing protein [Enterococcus raffinosus]QZO10886.1 DUF3110 domain-containing protein [Enterococcus raffinosus]
MTIPAEKVLNKIQELVIENSDSVLNFDQEQGEAEKLLEQQKKHLTVMQAINEQIKQLAANQASAIDQIKQLKADFNRLFEEYKQEYASLKEILLTMRVSYDTEKVITKQYLINENEKIILDIVNETGK